MTGRMEELGVDGAQAVVGAMGPEDLSIRCRTLRHHAVRRAREVAKLALSAESHHKVSPRRVELNLGERVVFMASGDAIRCRVDD
jgi:hypothetical protein